MAEYNKNSFDEDCMSNNRKLTGGQGVDGSRYGITYDGYVFLLAVRDQGASGGSGESCGGCGGYFKPFEQK